MDIEFLPLLARWAHILSAIIIFGGVAFMCFSFVPAAIATSASDDLREAIRKRWSRLMGPAILFLLVSGIYNFILAAKTYELDSFYLGLIAIKVILALVAFVLVSFLFGRSEKAQAIRQNEKHWFNVVTAILLAIVLMAGALKMDKNEPKEKALPTVDIAE